MPEACHLTFNCLCLTQWNLDLTICVTCIYFHRFGLYGLPLERTIFATEVPELGRGTSTPVTYASVLAGDTTTPPVPKPDYQLKELLNLPLEMGELLY